MTNTISFTEFNRITEGIVRAVIAVTNAYTDKEPSVKYVEDTTRKILLEYMEELGIDNVEKENDTPDDVDETNYNPYTDCDEYEDHYTLDDLGMNWW